MIDEAFFSLGQMMARMLALTGELVNEEEGVRSHIYEYELEAPVELDVARDETGALQIGSVPPLYYVDTTLRPSYHRLRFTASLDNDEQLHGD